MRVLNESSERELRSRETVKQEQQFSATSCHVKSMAMIA